MTYSAPDIRIRQPLPREKQDVRDLWACAFPEDPPAFSDWYFRDKYRARNTLGLFERGQPRAFLQMNPYRQRILGRTVPAVSMAGVSTWPDHRGRGFAGRLLRASLAVMRRRGVPAAFLYPFDHAFYRPHGYETVMNRMRCEARIARLAALEDGGTAVPVTGPRWAGMLAESYGRFMKRYSGSAVRDNREMARRLREHVSESTGIHAWMRSGIVRGYMLHHREGDAAVADEWAADDAAAFIGLLLAAAREGPPAERIVWFGPESEPFGMSGIASEERPEPFTMMRVADFAALVGGAPCGEDVEPSLIRIPDADCPWNRGPWLIGARYGRIEIIPADGPPEAEIAAAALPPLLIGTLCPESVLPGAPDRLLRRLSALFPPRPAFMWEMY